MKKTRVCSHCKTRKPQTIDHFHKARNMSNGLHTVCKPCRRAYNLPRVKLWAALNKDRNRDQNV